MEIKMFRKISVIIICLCCLVAAAHGEASTSSLFDLYFLTPDQDMCVFLDFYNAENDTWSGWDPFPMQYNLGERNEKTVDFWNLHDAIAAMELIEVADFELEGDYRIELFQNSNDQTLLIEVSKVSNILRISYTKDGVIIDTKCYVCVNRDLMNIMFEELEYFENYLPIEW